VTTLAESPEDARRELGTILMLAEQRAALAELLAELPQVDQRNLLQALESLRAMLARHPEL
jgi:hypothetical protein